MVTPPEAAEQQEKEALRSWSSSKYALFERNPALYPEMIKDEEGVPHPSVAFNGRDGTGSRIDPDEYWDSDGLSVPSGQEAVSMYSKRVLDYPQVTVKTVLPDLTPHDTGHVYFGTELGGGSLGRHRRGSS